MLQRVTAIFAEAKDLNTHRIQNKHFVLEVAYIGSLVDESKVSDFILVPFTQEHQSFKEILATNPSFKLVEDPARWADTLLRGFVLLQIESYVYALDAARVIRNQTPVAEVESTVQGPQTALNEDLIDSINLIRTRYPSPELKIEEGTVGSLSQTRLLLLYDQQRVDPTVLANVRKKLMGVSTEIVNAVGELEKLLTHPSRSLFPTMLITERPDRISRALGQGKMVLLMHGNMFGIVLPATFFDFMHAMEDRYESFWMTRTLILLRYLAIILTITLPALYISIISYNPELFRVQLAFSIAGSRSAVPYPSFIEVFLMLFLIEALIEASARLPRYIGSTATTVGGLILGQAAQQAGLVSSIMIIVTSVVAISNFVVPISSMSYAIRFLKYPLIVISIFFGVTGVAFGLFIYIVYLSQLRSFGKPYFRFIGGIKHAKGDIGQVNAR
ncbi:GerA spore germination protein [Paenibacillus curdlanolyticus YK9]|uniref:GerA spore germination protein n=1 Tax=Paenibacillus curdlanolyticus YK9 TaxID=717606 RepID=E0IDN8_9BACL|nr:spore germination protein [Paenibacillus curdlanolyticus]EFM09242.1 GerA spore germination protein [Paenibacillus curdlanolyticus YK9]